MANKHKGRGPEGYRARQHVNRVLKDSGSRLSQRLVLHVLCHAAEFDRPEVTITKPQIEDITGLAPNTVRAALRYLRAEGSIAPIRNVGGGRGNAVTYALQVPGQGAKSADATAGQGERDLWQRVREAYRVTDPAGCAAWLEDMQSEGVSGSTLWLIARTRYVATHCEQQLAHRLSEIAAGIEPGVTRVRIAAA